MKNFDVRELAWAAGLFEGEGCFTLSKGEWPQATAAIAMTDEEPIRRFAKAVGVGTVTGPFSSTNGTKLVWKWRVGSFEGFQYVVSLLWFGLGPRRRTRAVEVLEAMAERHMVPRRRSGVVPTTHCRRGHERTEENTYVWTDGSRQCKDCWKVRRQAS